MVSAIVHTLNEERNLPFALRSLYTWVDEIVVVDMGSTDDTTAIAARFGARVVPHPPTGFVEAARAFGCAQTRGDWIMVLDADELVPPPLARRLHDVVARDLADVVRIPRLNYLLGGPLQAAGWNADRDRHVRFFRRDHVLLDTRLHAPIRPRPGARFLDLDPATAPALVHFNYVSLHQFVERLDRYTSIEAAQAYDRGERPRLWRGLRRAGYEWAARFWRHGGYRAGWRGATLSLAMAAYPLVVEAKLAERTRAGTHDDVLRRYAAEAERWLADGTGTPPATARDHVSTPEEAPSRAS